MFKDSLPIATDDAGTPNGSLSIIDGPTAGRTVRQAVAGGFPFKLTIAHGDSNENKTLPSLRTNVRAAIVQHDVNGAPVNGYVQFSMLAPSDVISQADMLKLAYALLHFLTLDGSDAIQALPDSSVVLTRLLSREP